MGCFYDLIEISYGNLFKIKIVVDVIFRFVLNVDCWELVLEIVVVLVLGEWKFFFYVIK